MRIAGYRFCLTQQPGLVFSVPRTEANYLELTTKFKGRRRLYVQRGLKFYWPSFKAMLLGLIEEGVVPFSFVEGSYNQRLDIIAESGLPAGKTMWMFDQTDMAAVKERLGSWACFGGNVPASLFKAGTPQQMEDYVKNLIATVGQDGGYFLTPGAVVDDAEPENVHAYLKAAREYGVY